MRARRIGALLALLAAACGGGSGALTAGDPLLVAGASDLVPAFTVLGETFEDATGAPVTFNFSSSGLLAQQLVEGAPMDAFASADSSFVERVLDAGVGDPATRATYAVGRITIWSTEQAWGGWDDLRALVADEDVSTIAIANPEHAPYGRAARQALEAAGVWEAVEPRLVYGENVSDAQRLVASGNADAGVVALSLALAAGERGEGSWVLVEQELHAPLRQEIVVTAPDPGRAALARRFVEHVNSEQGRAVMRRFGFLLPGEDPPPGLGDG